MVYGAWCMVHSGWCMVYGNYQRYDVEIGQATRDRNRPGQLATERHP